MSILPVDDPRGIPTRYQASVFVDAESIVFRLDEAKELLGVLNTPEFLVGRAIDAEDVTGPPRFAFGTVDGREQLVLAKNRINFQRILAFGQEARMGDFESFCREAAEKIAVIMNYYGKRAHRCGAVQERFLGEMTEEEMQGVMEKLFHVPAMFASVPPFEWDWKLLSAIERVFGAQTEDINSSVAVRRSPGTVRVMSGDVSAAEEDIDRLRLELDFSTSHLKNRDRFDAGEVQAYYQEVPKWQASALDEMLRFIKREESNG